MTPIQLRFRASSHKDLSTTNSSSFTPDYSSSRFYLLSSFSIAKGLAMCRLGGCDYYPNSAILHPF